MNDTPVTIAKRLDDLLRERSGVERVHMVSDMFETAQKIAAASFPAGLDDIGLRERLCERFYSHDVDLVAFTQALRRSYQRHFQFARSNHAGLGRAEDLKSDESRPGDEPGA